MCKTFDAIYRLSKNVESNVLICMIQGLTIEGNLYRCDCGFDNDKCYDGIVTLENAKITCNKTNETKEYKWLNISSKQILAFTFKCCEK